MAMLCVPLKASKSYGLHRAIGIERTKHDLVGRGNFVDHVSHACGRPLQLLLRSSRSRKRRSARGRFRATASGSDRPMRVVRRSVSLVPAASLSGHSRIGAGQIKADALRDSGADHRKRI
jgi:hypothetical protein